jgi:hypothetical protein
MTTATKVGDTVLNVQYLEFIGNTQKWLSINMQPFETIQGVGECCPWNKTMTCFSVQHHDVKELASVPMHRNKIFDVITGFDADRGMQQFLNVSTHKDEIRALVKTAVEDKITNGNRYFNEKIAAAERQIIALKQEVEAHTAFCNECGDYIMNECDND